MSKVILINKYRDAPKVDRAYFIGRGSGVGNPFTHLPSVFKGSVRVATRAIACEKYEERFIKAMKLGKLPPLLHRMKADIENGMTIGLVCFCAPNPLCHGVTIKKWLEGEFDNM